jgi:ribose transport system ATP-binding protein
MRDSDLSGGAVSDLTFEVRPGEIVSLTGLLGAGQNDVGKLLFGASPRSSGEVQVDGRSVRAGDPPSAISAGIAYIPADRVNESTLALLSVRENVTLPKLRAHARRGRLSRRAEREFASRLVQDFDVRPPDPELKMHQLSGGNQQKAIIGKWLSIAPKVLIVDEPTQGVDVGARAQIYRLLEHAAGAGMAIVMVDTDLGEVERLSDRVLVFTDGRCHAELYGSEITRLRMTQLMNAQAVSPTAELEGTDDDDAVLTERAQGGSDA